MSTVPDARRRFDAASRRLGGVSRYAIAVYALVLVWGLGDVASTFLAMSATGAPGLERNPLMRLLLQAHPLFVPVVKAAVVLPAAAALLRYRAVVEAVPGWRLWFGAMVGVGTLVVCNNLVVAVTAGP